ncbi:MAG: hypothetical protein ACJAZQ_003150 [Cognaticolwellia sp.]|jgi:hypothetical protein
MVVLWLDEVFIQPFVRPLTIVLVIKMISKTLDDLDNLTITFVV